MNSYKIFITGLALLIWFSISLPAEASQTRVQVGERKVVKCKISLDKCANELRSQGVLVKRKLSFIQGVAANLNSESEAKLIATGVIQNADPDIEISALSHRDQAQILTWNIARIQADRAQAKSTGLGIDVAVIDTGIDLDHPDLIGRIKGGINLINPWANADDDNGHGTHVAGIIAAENNGFGVLGVAPKSNLYAVKALDRRGRGYLSDILAGMEWALNSGIEVINLSLGTPVSIPTLQEATTRLVQTGIVVVAAAGNDGAAVNYPAAYPGVIAVGAVGDEDELQRWSSHGSALDVVAPGDHIYSTYRRDRYRTMSGTSMATPHVAGLASLLLAYPSACDQNSDNQCSAEEVAARIFATADNLDTPGYDLTTGYGVINSARALGL
ncbi:S8 family peptidase [Candidatus Berkelbacteria bacterium]|nr:S8 family peptidase [Candidatus Berkelbacteria bacterium]